jgi:hypothetical protein
MALLYMGAALWVLLYGWLLYGRCFMGAALWALLSIALRKLNSRIDQP